MAPYPCVAVQKSKDVPLPSACQPYFAQLGCPLFQMEGYDRATGVSIRNFSSLVPPGWEIDAKGFEITVTPEESKRSSLAFAAGKFETLRFKRAYEEASSVLRINLSLSIRNALDKLARLRSSVTPQ
jgi:hypothetical protein